MLYRCTFMLVHAIVYFIDTNTQNHLLPSTSSVFFLFLMKQKVGYLALIVAWFNQTLIHFIST